MAERRFVQVAPGRQMHFHATGSGPPLIALHPSPLSGAALAAVAEWLADIATVIAPDTPGYGLSDALPEQGGGLAPYVEALEMFAQALGLERFGLYGSATGAQIAIEYAKAHPQRTAFLALENVASFDEATRRAVVEQYFPDLAPRSDASHMAAAWSMSRDLSLFFPWWQHTPQAQLGTPHMPLAAVHANAMALLQAGDYAHAYRAAFDNERAERLQAVRVPVAVLRWQDSILKQHSDALDGHRWEPNVSMVHCESGLDARRAALRETISELFGGSDLSPADGLPSSSTSPSQTPSPAREGQWLSDYAGGLRVARRPGDAAQPPALVIHDLGSSGLGARAALDECRELSRQLGDLIVPDLPGHGASLLPPPEDPRPEGYAASLADLVEATQATRLVGVGLGGYVAASLAGALGMSAPVTLIDPPLPLQSPEDCGWDFSPQWDGGHLFRAWHEARDSQLFWPPGQRDHGHALKLLRPLEAERIHRQAIDLLRSSAGLANAVRAFAHWQSAHTETAQAAARKGKFQTLLREFDALAKMRATSALLPVS